MASPKAGRKKPPSDAAQRDRIIEAALNVAEDWGWYDIRLHHVAERLDLSLADIRTHFRDADAIGDAWLARADQAMLAGQDEDFAALPVKERLQITLEAWLDALASRRKVTADIFRTKMWPVHVHHNLALVTWTSRTVQWWRDAALIDGKGQRRAIEEIGMTLIFLATLRQWCRDGSEGQQRSKDSLRRRLAGADRLMARCRSGQRQTQATRPV